MLHSTLTRREEGIYHSQLDTDGKLPVSLFLPQSYEPRYAYPLLVFLHGHGERESQWLEALPQISRRNYVGVVLRGPHHVSGGNGVDGYGWGRSRRCDGAIEDYVLGAIAEARRTVRIHPGRIFLAGVCEGASLAYRLGLTFADRIAGIVAFNGWLPAGPLPLTFPHNRLRTGVGPSVLIGHGAGNCEVSPERAQEAHDLLYAAGLEVELKYYPSANTLTRTMLRDADRWLMECCQVG